jgi:hypothetical protein
VFIKSFGLFWRADEVDWNPGKGAKGAFRLLGHRGVNLPGLRVADFRYQQGICMLHGNHGPYYVGLTKKQGLGKRLKDHLTDDHADMWDRFSWFGFCSVPKGKDDGGLCKLKHIAGIAVGSPNSVITDVEALLIRAMALKNINQNNFKVAKEWTQVKAHEAKPFIDKVRSRLLLLKNE